MNEEWRERRKKIDANFEACVAGLREIIHERTTWMWCDFKRIFIKFIRESRWVMEEMREKKKKWEKILSLKRKILKLSTAEEKMHLKGFKRFPLKYDS